MSEEKTPPKASARNVKWLLDEMPGWVAEGLIAEEAADKIAKRYQSSLAATGRERLVYIVGIIAALLLGTGVILFFASNWDDIPKYLKLVIVCTALWGSYLSGYYLRFVRGLDIMGDAVILLGSLLFGAGIFLVAQAFNINAHFPNGALLWMAGLIPLVILLKSKPILAEIAILFCIWIILEAVFMEGHHAREAAHRSLMIRCLWGLLIFGLIATLTYIFGHKVNAGLLIPAAVVWITIFVLATEGFNEKGLGQIFVVYFAFFVALGALGVFHRLKPLPPFGGVYQFFSVFVIAAILYVFTFSDVARQMPVRDIHHTPLIFSFLFMLIAAVLAGYLWTQAENDKEPYGRAELATYLIMGVVALALFFTFTHDRTSAVAWSGIISNMALFCFIIALIVIGSRGGYPRMVNMAIFFFAVDFITRYFDWFWKLRYRSLFFISLGLILLIGGIFLEKQRKKWVLAAREVGK